MLENLDWNLPFSLSQKAIPFNGQDEMAMQISENQILSIRDWPDGRQVVTITDHIPDHLIYHQVLPVSRVPACMQRFYKTFLERR